MKILVTGGNGLIGKSLNDYVNSIKDINTWTFMGKKDCNLLNYDSLLQYIRCVNPEYIIHLAAQVGGLFKNISHKTQMFEENLIINYNVIKCAHECNVQNVMCCLSTCIFPHIISYPIDESQIHNGVPHDSNYGYAYAKRMLDIHCKIYREEHNRNYFCIIPTNVYGPHDNFNLENGHVIPSLIHRCYLAKKNNIPFYVKGSGIPLRQFIYSYDVAKCVYYLIFNYKEKKNVILSQNSKSEISIKKIAELISKHFDYNNIIFQPEFSDGQYQKTVNTSYLDSILPEQFIFTNIENGIIETVNWFVANYDSCRK